MDQDGKKISFGFSKLTKKPNIIPKPPSMIIRRPNIQLIDCLEGQAIKLKDAVKEVKGPLVIPLTQSKTIFDHQNEKKLKHEVDSKNNVDNRPDSELTADELAARELIKDAQNSLKSNETAKIHTLQAVLKNTFEVEGKEESTREDYEAIPISDYGLAMLRGMGWSESTGVGRIPGKSTPFDDPVLRPKGLGLGANKLVNHSKEKQSTNKNEEELILKKGGYGKIVTGKHKGSYCEVQGFDEDGRIIVKTTVNGLILNLNELLVRPVSKEEYSKSSKVINNAKYEEYKNKEAAQCNNPEKSLARGERSRSRKSSSEDSDKKNQSRRNSRSDSEDSSRRNYSKQREQKNNKSDSGSSSRKNHSKSRYREQRNSRSDSEGSTKRNHSKRRERRNSRSDSEGNFKRTERRNSRSDSEVPTKRNYSKKKERRNSRSDSEGSTKRNHSKRRERRNSKSDSEGTTKRNLSKRRERRNSKSDSEDSNKKSHSRLKEHKTYREDKHNYRSKTKKKYRSSSVSSTDSVHRKRRESKSSKERKLKSKKSKHQKEHRSNLDYDSDHNHTRKSYSKHKY